jgi:hypothetical protein
MLISSRAADRAKFRNDELYQENAAVFIGTLVTLVRRTFCVESDNWDKNVLFGLFRREIFSKGKVSLEAIQNFFALFAPKRNH